MKRSLCSAHVCALLCFCLCRNPTPSAAVPFEMLKPKQKSFASIKMRTLSTQRCVCCYGFSRMEKYATASPTKSSLILFGGFLDIPCLSPARYLCYLSFQLPASLPAFFPPCLPSPLSFSLSFFSSLVRSLTFRRALASEHTLRFHTLWCVWLPNFHSIPPYSVSYFHEFFFLHFYRDDLFTQCMHKIRIHTHFSADSL